MNHPQPSPNHADLETLVHGLCDGTLSGGDRPQLERRLIDDPAARVQYLKLLLVHGELAWHESPGVPFSADELQGHARVERLWESESVEPLDAGPTPNGRGSWWRKAGHNLREMAYQPLALSLLVSGLFITTVVLSLALWVVPGMNEPAGSMPTTPKPSRSDYVARLMMTRDVEWVLEAGQTAPRFKEDLQRGQTLRLARGRAQLLFDNGASLLLAGPAELTITGETSSRLAHGALLARVPQDAVGFVVETPQATITDLGTEFGVLVDRPSHGMTSHVYVGEVEVAPHSGEPPLRLAAGRSVRIDAAGRMAVQELAEADRDWRQGVVSGIYRRRLTPASYDMPNGSQGQYAYLDVEYDGQGDRDVPEAPLTCGRGRLTDGQFADASRPWEEEPWLGWKIDPTLVFHFDESVVVDELVLHCFRNAGVAIRPPSRIELSDEQGNTATVEVEDGPSARHRIVGRGLGLRGRTITVTLVRREQWVFCDEIEFFGSVYQQTQP